ELVDDVRIRLRLGCRRAGARDLDLQLVELLVQPCDAALDVGKLEADARRTPLHLARVEQRRKRAGHVVEDALAPFLARLDPLPVFTDPAGRARLDLPEHVRVPTHELRMNLP